LAKLRVVWIFLWPESRKINEGMKEGRTHSTADGLGTEGGENVKMEIEEIHRSGFKCKNFLLILKRQDQGMWNVVVRMNVNVQLQGS